MSVPPKAKPKKRSRTPATSARAGRGGAFSGEHAPAADWRVRPLPEPVDWDEAQRMYAEGKSYRQIAEALGQNYGRICEGFKQLGAARPRKWQSTNLPHGARLRDLWNFLRLRCIDPKHRDFDRYGRQGIRFAWDSFDDFYAWSMAHGYASGLRLGRKDLAGDFEPRSCKWVPRARSRRAHPHPARFKSGALGEFKGTGEWARDPRCHVTRPSLEERLAYGWPPEEAVTLPVGAQPSRRVTPIKRPRRATRARACIDWDEARRLYERWSPEDVITGCAVQRVNSTWLVVADAEAYGDTLVELDVQQGRIVGLNRRVVPLDEKVGKDNESNNAIAGFYHRTSPAEEWEVEPVLSGNDYVVGGYVGSASCVSCHPAEHKVWSTSKHSQAWNTLLSAQRDLVPKCVSCHVVGLGEPTGYERITNPESLRNVGCAMCHGGGARHVMNPHEVRMRQGARERCSQCHDPEHSKEFDLDSYWQLIRR